MENEQHDVLPDVLDFGLKVVFCGTAAGRTSAATKSYYAHPQNQFWRTLAIIGLTPSQLQPHEYRQLLAYGIGLTDLAKSHAGMDTDIPQEGFDPETFHAKISWYRPSIVAFTSKKAAQVYYGHSVTYGVQPKRIGDTLVIVLPSPSPAARGSWDLRYWHELGTLALQSSEKRVDDRA
jgi:double-stranded uracil-DNA glycosylase